MSPKNIVLIKSHSMGIGDLLRSSAAWRALKSKWPEAKLHLLMLNKHPGYATEQLIEEHKLLASANFISVNTASSNGQLGKRISRKKIYTAVKEVLGDVTIDMVIDCEPYGLRTSLLSFWIARNWRAKSVGIAQFPLRRFFYTQSAPSLNSYARKHYLSLPMDYAERDFVVLASLKIAREGIQIELDVSEQGLVWASKHLSARCEMLVVTLNIGCGTPDALPKRPPMELLVDAMVALFEKCPFKLYLSGANFEYQVNEEFKQKFVNQLKTNALQCQVENLAGKGNLSELTGLLHASDLVVSSDSGPYHMAVALDIPTVCWFTTHTPASHHTKSNVKIVVNPSVSEFLAAIDDVLKMT